MEWLYGESFSFIGKTCAQIIEEVLHTVLNEEAARLQEELQKWHPFAPGSEPIGPIVDGSITPVIDDPAHLLPQGECEECGGPCRWEYADSYGDEEETE